MSAPVVPPLHNHPAVAMRAPSPAFRARMIGWWLNEAALNHRDGTPELVALCEAHAEAWRRGEESVR